MYVCMYINVCISYFNVYIVESWLWAGGGFGGVYYGVVLLVDSEYVKRIDSVVPKIDSVVQKSTL